MPYDILPIIVDIMMDYRLKRLKWMKANPGDDAMPKELSREAEALAIIHRVLKETAHD